MMWGAHLAGKAINITKTTGAHALSYTMTACFGIPHGQAVAVTLPAWVEFNAEVADTAMWAVLGVQTAAEAAGRLRAMMHRIGLATRLTDLGITTQEHFALIARGVNVQRLAHNPRHVTPSDITTIIHASA
jgi:alcohol dehydrogenase class IV